MRTAETSARALLGAGLAALALGACGQPEAAPPRHCVLVVVDTLRADSTGIAGYERPTTPFLDELARERGVAFLDARATAPWTKPSVASILTGLDPRHHQVTMQPHRLHGRRLTLAEAFDAAGFQTAAFQTNILLASPFGFDQGFESYDEDSLASHDESTGAEVQRKVARWLDESRDPERRFFLYVHHYEPHFRYLPVETADFAPDYDGRLTGDEPMSALVGATHLLEEEDVTFLRARYDAEIAYQDELLRELWDSLVARGLAGETLFVVTSDHGEEFLDHGDLSHQYKMYDELLRVPLVVVRPSEPEPGRTIAAPVSLSDLGRTLLDLCGLRDADFPGASLVPLLDGRDAPAERAVLAHTSFARVPQLLQRRGIDPDALDSSDEPLEEDMIVLDGWKLVRELSTGRERLYDLRADPRERHDVLAREPERAAALRDRLDAFLAENASLAEELPPESVQLSPEVLRRIEELGYEQ